VNNEVIQPIKEIATLIKFGKIEHLEDFKNGNVFLNKIRFFKELKHDPQRVDEFEGALGCYPKERFAVKMTNLATGESFDGEFDNLYLHDDKLLESHIFCLYAIHAG